MAKIDDGGPAFPMTAVYDQEGRGIMEGASGMSLRDWFAGQALPQCMKDLKLDSDKNKALAAYQMADAMLVARKAR